MFDEVDSIDNILFPPVTTRDRALGKFRPKARAKPASASEKPSDATQLVPPTTDSKPELKQPYLQTSLTNSCTVSSEHHSTLEPVQQPEGIITESTTSECEYLENFQQNQRNLCQDADVCLDAPNRPLMASDNSVTEEGPDSTSARMGSSALKICASRVRVAHQTFGDMEGSYHEDQLFNAEKEVVSKCGQGKAVVEAYIFNMNPHDGNSQCAHATGDEETVDDTNNRTTSSEPNVLSSELNATLNPLPVAKELSASESIDDGLQVSLSTGDLQALPDDPKEVEMTMLSGPASCNTIFSQHSGNADIRQVGKFQPKKNKSQSKGRPAKSVSFILPDASDSAPPPVESFSEIMDPSSVQVMTDRSVDDPLCSSYTYSDCNAGLQMGQNRMGEEDRGENGLPIVLADIPPEPQSLDVQNLKQRIQEGRTTSENEDSGANKPSRKLRKRMAKCSTDEIEGRSNDDFDIDNFNFSQMDDSQGDDGHMDSGANKPSRKLRKRMAKCSTDEIEGRSNDDCDIDNFNVSQMDDSQGDDGHMDEDRPKSKRARRKSKKQTTEIEKPTRRRKKVSEKPDSAAEDPPKKKFPHSTRRKRRQVNQALLLTPEDEIDPRQISIKDLIMLAEHKEQISTKESEAMSKLFSNQSTGSVSNNENTLFGEDQELNKDGEEANHNIQLAPKKLNYHSYMNRPRTVRWSKSETELLYEAIRQFGTDFAMIQQLFPNRTRHQVKLKFKIEERKHPLRVHDALLHPSKDRSHIMQVIKQLQSRAEPTSTNGETTGDQSTTLQDGVGKNEEETGGIQNEEQHQFGYDGEVQDSEEFNDSKGEVNNHSNFNEYEDLFEWDGGTYPEDTEKDIWEI